MGEIPLVKGTGNLGVILTIQTFFRSKKTLYKYWTSIKIKIGMTCLKKQYDIKINIVQEQWLKLKINFLLSYNMKWKSNQHSKLLFFKINWHFDVRLNMHIWKTKFSSLNQYLFDLLLLKKCREDSYRPKYTCYSFWIETSHKYLKVAPAKKFLRSV